MRNVYEDVDISNLAPLSRMDDLKVASGQPEELVIKRHEVQGEELVEADVRRERAEVRKTGEVTGTGLRGDDEKRRR